MGKKNVFATKTFGLVVITAILTLAVWLLSPTFLAPGNVRQLLITLSFEGVMLAGITILFLSGNFDMSAGGVGAVSLLIFGLIIQNFRGLPWIVALIAALLTELHLYDQRYFNECLKYAALYRNHRHLFDIRRYREHCYKGNSIPINAPGFTDIGKSPFSKWFLFFLSSQSLLF